MAKTSKPKTAYGIHTKAIHSKHSNQSKSSQLSGYYSIASDYDSTENMQTAFSFKKPGHVYGRISHPSLTLLEDKLATLEGAPEGSALVLSSGMTAIFFSITNICQAGDEIVASCNLYAGTIKLFSDTLKQFGIKVHFVNQSKPEAFAHAITERTKLLFCESISNPCLEVADISAIADIAHAHHLPLIVDSTLATPVLQQPLDFGADIVVHSLSKWLSGHGEIIGGAVIDGGTFPWSIEKFPLMADFFDSTSGVRFADLPTQEFEYLPYIQRMRMNLLTNIGGCLAPDAAGYVDRGLATLGVRVKQHCNNALAVAQFLQQNKHVAWVCYPGLTGDHNYQLCQKYLKGKGGGCVGFGLKQDDTGELASRMIASLSLIKCVMNLGDVRSLIRHPITSVDMVLDETQLTQSGIKNDLILMSVGLEEKDDIIADLDQAIDAIFSHTK